MTEAEKNVMTDSFPCAGCGSQMVFDPDSQELLCEHCGRKEKISSPVVEAPEYLYNPQTDEYKAPDWNAVGSRTVRCAGCGAQTVISSAAMTMNCPFCGGNYVVDQNEETNGILPETVMPFQVSRKHAFDQFKKWVKNRFWAPGKFKKAGLQPENLTGVYLPFWTYDADMDTSYYGEGGRDYVTTETRVVNGKTETYTVTHTQWYPISGEKTMQFDDEAVCAVREADDALLQGIGKFDTKMLNRYSPAFLAGFHAQRYNIGLGEGFLIVRPRMQSRMESAIREENNFQHYRNMQYNHVYRSVRFKHILLPVWMSSYQYKKKIYRFLVNGESGSVSGKSPVSVLKVILFILILLAVAAGIYFLSRSTGGTGHIHVRYQ